MKKYTNYTEAEGRNSATPPKRSNVPPPTHLCILPLSSVTKPFHSEEGESDTLP
jgi:hypothetical protein